MSLLQEMYNMPEDAHQDDGQSEKSTIDVDCKFAFDHSSTSGQYFIQMANMPQFRALLEKNFTHAFVRTVREFQQNHDDDQSGQRWTGGYQGQTKISTLGRK